MHALRSSIVGALMLPAFGMSRADALQTRPDPAATVPQSSWRSAFDGKTLDGWTLVGGEGPGYVAKDGVLACPKDGGGNLFLKDEYGDFAFRFEFRTEQGGNNGVGIRAPLQGDAAYVGMEVQILDDDAPQYASLLPAQYCGSVYKVAAARRGALKRAGEWNAMEIVALGRRVTVKINGRVVTDVDLNTVTDAATLAEHPGMLREKGHVGFLGHQSLVEFRGIEIADLATHARADNTAPPGFAALFDGKGLSGWKGLVEPDKGPPARMKLTPEELKDAQAKADQQMRDHWRVVDGALSYDGKGQSLCTARDYGDFELWVDWKIGKDGDSGIYLRGSPQVQIWDNKLGSGGLYNNKKPENPSNPLAVADRPVGEWNHFRILMVGERVTVYLNEELVVNHTVMENYWERDKPIYPIGQIELQHHNSPLSFKNVYLRELPRAEH